MFHQVKVPMLGLHHGSQHPARCQGVPVARGDRWCKAPVNVVTSKGGSTVGPQEERGGTQLLRGNSAEKNQEGVIVSGHLE